MESASALDRAIEAVGSQAKLAEKLGVSQQAVSYWVKKGGRVPAEFVLQVETATGVSRSELRPDLFGEVAA